MERGWIDRYVVQQNNAFGALRPPYEAGLREFLKLMGQYQEFQDDLRWLAYVIATARHETARTYMPIREKGTQRYFIERYWLNVKVRVQLGNTSQRDAYLYCGNGYVQLTGRSNYQRFEKRLNIPLLSRPELANDPVNAAKIMHGGMIYGLFTGKKLADYLNKKTTDFTNARRIINGLDCAAQIAYDAEKIWQLLS